MVKRLCACVVLLSAVACGNSSTAPTAPAPTPTQATITVTLSPNPVMSTDCSPTCQAVDGRLFRWRVQGTVTIQETSGISGNVNFITVTAFNPQLVFGADVIMQRSGTNHVAPRGALAVPVTILYGLVGNANASRQTLMPFVVDFTDDRGNHLTGIAQWSVN